MSQTSAEIYQLTKKAAHLRGVIAALDWDKETFMPEGSHENRSHQLQIMAGLVHELVTGEEYKRALSKVIDLKTGKVKGKPSKEDEINFIRLREDFLRDTALPVKFVQESAKLVNDANVAWKKAREQNKFKLFEPYLDKIIKMNQKKAEYLGYKDHPYDALLNLYEPGMTTAELKKLFDPLKKSLKELVKKLKKKKPTLPFKTYSKEEQLALADDLLKRLPFDLNYGRLDISTHPFSTAQHPTDSRITTRLNPSDPLSNLLTTLHEAGHGLYEMGLDPKHFGTPLCEAISLGVHESQSRWWETRIGLSKPFWKGFTPVLQKHGILKGVKPDAIYEYVNYVEPSFIRVESDEVTYPLHVILRFEIEVELIEGKITAKQVPARWNQLMKELIGITPETDTLGCLQDVHWSIGAMGYFPTYLLGNLYAAQFFETFEKKHPDWQKRVEKLDFSFIVNWLKENIHQHGRKYTSKELIKKVTGKPFSPEPFISYINKKFIPS